jgi:tetratricopeptide (TPR) repeat protein
MIGWVMLGLLMTTTAALLVVLRVPKILWPLAGSALMLGAAGYAWQGRPDWPGQPAVAKRIKLPPDSTYLQLRGTFFGRYGREGVYFGISDRQLADGDVQFAAGIVTGGLQFSSDNIALWTELGNITALHDSGLVSPASLFAFKRAMSLAPEHPGPPFFLGLAYIRAGQFAAARPWWERALRLTPADASYRSEIADRLALLDAALKDPRLR